MSHVPPVWKSKLGQGLQTPPRPTDRSLPGSQPAQDVQPCLTPPPPSASGSRTFPELNSQPGEGQQQGPRPLTYRRAQPRPGRQQAPNKCWPSPCQMLDSAWTSGAWKALGALLGTPTCKVLPAASLGWAPGGHTQASPLPHQHLTGPVVDGVVTPVSPLSQTEGGQG